MKLRIALGAALVAALVAATVTVVSASRGTVEEGTVYVFNTTNVVDGADAFLMRNNRGVLGWIHTNGLTPGNVYTVWWVTFASPENCTGGACGLDDVLAAAADPDNDPVGVGVFYATGHQASPDGSAYFAGFLRNGDTSDCVPAGDGPFVVLCNPLDDSHDAVVHMVIRDHGPPVPGQLAAQRSSFTGGCSAYACTNVQAAVFEP